MSVTQITDNRELLSEFERISDPRSDTVRVTMWDNYNSVEAGSRLVIGEWDRVQVKRTLESKIITDFVRVGSKIKAIKHLREKHHFLGLREAKEMIESIMV